MNTAIVTVQLKDGGFERDMELPTNLPVSALSERLLGVLRILDEDRFLRFNSLRMVYRGIILDPNKTLAELKVWDGSIVIVQ